MVMLVYVPWPKLFSNNYNSDVQSLRPLFGYISKKNPESNKSEPNTGANYNNSNNSSDSLAQYSSHLFDMYSWYISLIITLLAAVAGIFVYYNWRGSKKIQEEWENYFKKETEVNKAFYEIRYDVVNDPRLGNGKDEEKLQGFTRAFRGGQIDRALEYAFLARDIQPDRIKPRGDYNKEEKQQWECALQYWTLAAYILPDKDAYQKEHIGFIYEQMGNAFREIANYAVHKINENMKDEDLIPIIKGILSYYIKALSAYEFVLNTDLYHNRVLNNEANLLMEIYRLKEKLFKEGPRKQQFKELWNEALASSSILWSKLIENDNVYDVDNLINEAYNLLKKVIEENGLSTFDIAKNNVFYYRNYAIVCYLKAKKMTDNVRKEELNKKFLKYLNEYIIWHEDRKKAIWELKRDEDLVDYNAIQEERVQYLFRKFE